MSIAKKIIGGAGAALAFLILIGMLSYWTTTRLVETNRQVTQTYDGLLNLEEVSFGLKDAQRAVRGYVISGKKEWLKPHEIAKASIPESLKKVERATGEKHQQKLKEIRNLIDEMFREFARFIELRDGGDDKGFKAAVEAVKAGEGQKDMETIRGLVEDITAKELTDLNKRKEDSESTAQVTQWTIGVATVLAVLLVGLGCFFLVRSILDPLRRLLEGTEKIGQGELNYRVNLTSHDEVGELARAFDRMTAKRQQAHEAMRDAANQITAASAEILAGTTQQASGAQEQAAAVTQTMTTVDEVAQTAEQGAQRAKAIGESVQRTLEIGKAGRKVVEESLVAMEAVKEKVETTAENILTLAEQAQAISAIIATVNDIAEQTNLLALNAAIEASRAGEHGKGFTVVAGEVKALADQSKKATGQVRQILGEIQKATNTAVLSTEEVTKGVAAAIKVGGQAGDTIKTLAETLTETSQTVKQIAASVGQQATGMAQIHQAMKNIDQVAKQNTVATRQAAQAAENLNTLGTRLASLTAE